MPLYRYTPASSPCKLCGTGFDRLQSAAEPAFAACPTCGQAVTRAATHAVYAPKLLAPLSISSAKQAGFTVMKRVSSGEYEKQ